MKKTLLATAIAGTMAATGAQAATVYDQDGTELIVNGRISMGVATGGPSVDGDGNEIDNGAEFVDVYSRLGLSMSQEINSDLSAFGRVEWRFTGDERNTDQGFNEVRHSYVGLRSNSWGTIQAGNYDSFYNTQVAAPFDVYIDRGLEFSSGDGGDLQARGDSVGYMTPNLEGFQAFLSGKHLSERGTPEADTSEEGNEIAMQGGATYETGPVRLGLGFVEDTERDGGTGENIYGGTAAYSFNDDFSARLGYETREADDDGVGGYDTVGLGGSFTTGQLTFHADVYQIERDDEREDRTAWAGGAYYDMSSNFQLFTEVHQADQGSVTFLGDGDDFIETEEDDDIYWLTGARYFF